MTLSLRKLFPIVFAALLFSAAACMAQTAEQTPPGASASHAPTGAADTKTGIADASNKAPRISAAVPPAAEAAKAPDAGPDALLPPSRRAEAGPSGAPVASDGGAPYLIGALDVLYVRVWGNNNLTGLVDVRPDGMISMPLIGEIKADGTTVGQLREAVRARLEEFLIKPEVDVQVTKVNSKKYYIFGEVGRPGEFSLIGNLTILDALSNAGGFRDFANQKKIYLLRGTQKLFFNYKDVSNGKHMEQNIRLQNGDRIFVP